MSPELIEAIASLFAMDKDILGPKLDEIEAKSGPVFARKVQIVRAFLSGVWNTIPGVAADGFVEVAALIKKGSGPVVDTPADVV